MKKKTLYFAVLLTIAWVMNACSTAEGKYDPNPPIIDTIVPPNNPTLIWNNPINRDSLQKTYQNRQDKQKYWEEKINSHRKFTTEIQ